MSFTFGRGRNRLFKNFAAVQTNEKEASANEFDYFSDENQSLYEDPNRPLPDENPNSPVPDEQFNFDPTVDLGDLLHDPMDSDSSSWSSQDSVINDEDLNLLNNLSFNLIINGAKLIQGPTLIEESNWTTTLLYKGTKWKVEDLMLVLEMFKVMGKMGDGFENCILGLIASILPADNSISAELLSSENTNYFFQKSIKLGHQKFQKMRIYEVQACRKGCCLFLGDNLEADICPVCLKNNDANQNEIIYYFPIVDRLVKLLTSNLIKLFSYEFQRKQPEDGFLEDVYDGSTWKWFMDQMGNNEVLIGLQFCWDGADMFNKSGKVIWPLCISILNFPKDLRDKLNIGLHVIAMCTG
jgi:hypothetical protein